MREKDVFSPRLTMFHSLQPAEGMLVDGLAATAGGCHWFEATCLASAQTLMRVLGLFAQRELVPNSIEMRASAEAMTICVVQSGLDEHQAQVMLEKIRMLPYVIAAELTVRPSGLQTEKLVSIKTHD